MTSVFLPPLLLAAVLGPTPPPDGASELRANVGLQPYYLSTGGFWLIFAGGCIVLALVMLWVMLRRPNKPAAPGLTPRQLAARRLAELEAQMDELDARSFGGAVANVLRVYIGAQYGLHPERQTSEEFLASITGSRVFSPVEHAFLTEFLDGCDLLKFARADATLDRKKRLLGQARDFLEDSAEPPSLAHPAPQSLTLGA